MVFALLIPIVSIICGSLFIAVVGFAVQRRREREAYYRYEFQKKLVDAGELDGEQLLRIAAREERASQRKQREGLKIVGAVLVSAGLGTIAGLWLLTEPGVALVGVIPFFVGVSLLVYAVFFAPKEESI